MRYNDFQSGCRCPICSGKQRLTFEYIKDFIEGKGYKLLSTEYVNNVTKLEMVCPEGHTFQMRYSNFQSGNRCPVCNGKQKHTYSNVKLIIEKTGYKLLSTEYKNNRSKLKMICPEGHTFTMKFNNFHTGKRRCPDCSPTKRLTYDQAKQYIENEGYVLLSTEYKNVHSKIKIMCPEGHIFKMRYHDFQQEHRCPICAAQQTTSKGEKELVQYVSEIYNGTIVENDRNTIVNHLTGRNLELDIFLPDINKAIEYNGTYWHSGRYQKIKDKIKQDKCKELGIDLLIVDENLWRQDKSFCLNQVRNHITIYA